MKVAILGANGRSGKVCVEECLNAGFEVRAGVYRHNDLHSQNNLEVVSVDGANVEQVERFVQGCDAVVSMIGHVKGSPEWMQSETITNVINAMEEHGVKRLISLTGTGARMDGDKPSFLDRFLNFGVALVDPARIKDGVRHLEIIKNSNLDWTVVRVLKLTESTNEKSYSLSYGGPAMMLVPRRTVAKAVVAVLKSDEFIKSAPVISKKER